ncbi:Myocyte-specific enhancer factor 2C like [Actinidia chinensis var. chinensis]|uniref:Myocyte-specific enhancer factor 2C like n=1 Tax=Actinidia chinensis var. chinensis TaxID=1590841 RepID=A0A2R6R5T0_ACTCC|nr:Myocyte-specific enhancer factor 2C like [Actinidia chinensis var. chinensis]
MEEEAGKQTGGERESSNTNRNLENTKKAKSCKGCLYYSSTLKSNSRNPVCAGITRSLPQVSRYLVGESEVEASKVGRSLADFKYGCVGYSVYSDGKDPSANGKEKQAELPVCVGLEILIDKKIKAADAVPAHVHNTEDARGLPQTRTHKPAHSVGDEFMSRFSRNASVVAMGVAKNVRKIGNHIKERIDDILYLYRSRPK